MRPGRPGVHRQLDRSRRTVVALITLGLDLDPGNVVRQTGEHQADEAEGVVLRVSATAQVVVEIRGSVVLANLLLHLQEVPLPPVHRCGDLGDKVLIVQVQHEDLRVFGLC